MIEPILKPVVELIGQDGNAFFIIGKASKALRKAGADKEYVNKYRNDAMSGDYNHVLSTTMEYCEVE